MKIKFVESPPARPEYQAGATVEFNGPVQEGYARKYVGRGWAVEVGRVERVTIDSAKAEQAERERQEAERKAQDAAKFADRSAVKIPDDLDALSWAELRSLASKLTDDTVHNKGEALAAIDAERGRRAIAA